MHIVGFKIITIVVKMYQVNPVPRKKKRNFVWSCVYRPIDLFCDTVCLTPYYILLFTCKGKNVVCNHLFVFLNHEIALCGVS